MDCQEKLLRVYLDNPVYPSMQSRVSTLLYPVSLSVLTKQQVFGHRQDKLLRVVVKDRPGFDLGTSTSLSRLLLMDAYMDSRVR